MPPLKVRSGDRRTKVHVGECARRMTDLMLVPSVALIQLKCLGPLVRLLADVGLVDQPRNSAAKLGHHDVIQMRLRKTLKAIIPRYTNLDTEVKALQLLSPHLIGVTAFSSVLQ